MANWILFLGSHQSRIVWESVSKMTIASAIPGLEMLGRFNCGVSNFQIIHYFFFSSKCVKSQFQYIKNLTLYHNKYALYRILLVTKTHFSLSNPFWFEGFDITFHFSYKVTERLGEIIEVKLDFLWYVDVSKKQSFAKKGLN